MTTYVMRNGELVDKALAGEPNTTVATNIMSDITPFVTQEGVPIGSRSTLRAYEQARGIRQCGNDWTGSTKPAFWDKAVSKGREI